MQNPVTNACKFWSRIFLNLVSQAQNCSKIYSFSSNLRSFQLLLHPLFQSQEVSTYHLFSKDKRPRISHWNDRAHASPVLPFQHAASASSLAKTAHAKYWCISAMPEKWQQFASYYLLECPLPHDMVFVTILTLGSGLADSSNYLSTTRQFSLKSLEMFLLVLFLSSNSQRDSFCTKFSCCLPFLSHFVALRKLKLNIKVWIRF